ncbi:hypothetical protein J3F84DRAFT_355908 [Trichoderma pleuroticola]
MYIHSLYAVPRLSFHKIYKRQTHLLCFSISPPKLHSAFNTKSTIRQSPTDSFLYSS